jgi:peroxiredoxin
MDLLAVVARIALAAVFAAAGLAKLKDRRAARQGLVDFGMPAALARPGAVILPSVELATALALVAPATVWGGAIAAIGLLSSFTAAIGVNLWRGRHPDCRCFGQIAAGPIGAQTVVRNVTFIVLAGVLVAQGPDQRWPDVVQAMSALATPSVTVIVLAALALVTLVEGLLLLQLLQQNGRILLRIQGLEAKLAGSPATTGAVATATAGLPVGARAPAFQLAGVHGETLTLDALRASGRPVLLVFTDPACGPCTALLPDLARWQRELLGTLTLAFVSRGPKDANRTKVSEHMLTNVLLQQKDEVADMFLARGTPAAVLVNSDGTIASPVVAGADAIRGLVSRFTAAASPAKLPSALPTVAADGRCPHCGQVHAAAPAATASSARIGEPAPEMRLPDLSGKTVSLTDFKGKDTLVLFWNPSCGFCQQMTEEWKTWEAAGDEKAPRPLIVSTGTVEANRAMSIRSTMVLEPQFSVGYRYGASGTPSAVLVDAEGRIASAVAVGAQAVMALARGGKALASDLTS